MRLIVIKEGPIVFLRNVFVMEIIALLFFFTVSFFKDYGLLFRNLGLDNYIRFDLFEIIVFSLFQIIYISLLFLDWYFTHYEIKETEIIKKYGLLWRKKKSVNIKDVASVSIYQSLLDRITHHATIILEHNNERITKMKNVSNYEEYAHIIKQSVYNSSDKGFDFDIVNSIKQGEGLHLEFKETLRWDTRKKEMNKEMEKAVIKTIVGFLNASGGTLIIGINDNGEIVGLANDYKTLQQKKDKDGFENYVNTLIKNMIGLYFLKYINIKFEIIKEKEICIIKVNESHKPAYLINGDKKEDFFVRIGNSTQPFSMSEAGDYINNKWK